jgi:hypothetical protein
MAGTPFEIPQALRNVTEQNIKQAHAAYEQLTDFVTKAVGAWMGAMPASPVAAGFNEFQDRAAEITKKNADSAFALVEKIAKAQNFQEILTLHSRPDESVHHANAGALQADRGGFPEAATRLIPQRAVTCGAFHSPARSSAPRAPHVYGRIQARA